ncbi:bifunctional glycosyltransferase family 2/GtrA family protein [Oryzihumus leptocrescens]|uniref:dolichyl-phosphate beta-glucosyltransferase n=1 Tax=Oryzihumus leptocrescens TaxID=297536 RepID=A0A542Z978_9MICO|nr:bifunctional glycosyltransferase family 2/GtrA family protein [Oryzihumus leptocrescens]TQL56896.1 glycosyltransferase involved in cell wall biosynthesis [Oryzihumus leptocrescens]
MSARPVLDVVIPVHNEEHTLPACVRRLAGHLHATFPYPFRITVADNASTDRTWDVALGLAAAMPEVSAVHLDRKGRGRALKAVWSASDAPILAYMDVDLSTDLDALWPLVAPLMSGHSDVAIGSRLARGARVVRGAKREVVSRAYNLILRAALGSRFSDAQCGFKAIRADVAAELLPLVEDPTWFFDTELLVLAERSGLRIHEVPVDWFDDPDSRVAIVQTALDDLRGVRRVRRGLRSGRLPVEDIRARIGRRPHEQQLAGRLVGQLWRFGGIGLASTVLHLGLFALLRPGLPSAQVANVLALFVATVFNTAANRRWTFGLRDRRRAGLQQAQGLLVFGITLVMTSAALGLLHVLAPGAGTGVQTLTIAVANMLSTAVRFAAMRWWIFRTPARPATAPATPASPPPSAPDPSNPAVPEPETTEMVRSVGQGGAAVGETLARQA